MRSNGFPLGDDWKQVQDTSLTAALRRLARNIRKVNSDVAMVISHDSGLAEFLSCS